MIDQLNIFIKYAGGKMELNSPVHVFKPADHIE